MKLVEFTNPEKEKNVIFSFIRGNPPHIGHELLVHNMVKAAKLRNADHVLYLSQTTDTKRNPIEWNLKRSLFSHLFPGITISNNKNIRTPMDALKELSATYDNIVMIVGEDRVEGFKKFGKYAKELGVNFAVINAGNRDGTTNLTDASGTKMRELAQNGNFRDFYSHLPGNKNERLGKSIYNLLRAKLVT